MKGLRISKTINNQKTTYLYDGNLLLTEITPTYRNDFLYDENGILYGFIHDYSTKYFYVRDVFQNILGIVDENGNLVVKYAYTAYGTLKSISGSLATTIGQYNPFRFKGYYYDQESELFYCNGRYYSSGLCRFIQPAEVSSLNLSSINGLNLYSYANNNPLNVQYNTALASAGIVGGGVVSSVGLSLGNGFLSNCEVGGAASSSRNLPSVPRWLGILSTGLDHGFTMINPIRSAIACLQFTDLWDLMRLDGVTEISGALSKAATGIGWGLSIAGGIIAGYEKYASGTSLSSAIAGGLINAGISIGAMYASTTIATAAMGAVAASSLAIPGGIIIVGGAIIAVGVGVAINHLFTKLEIGGNTIEGHLNDFVDWLIFWD